MARKRIAALAPPPPPPAPVAPPAPPEPVGTKLDRLTALLRRPQGATIAQMVELTGWQVHTVRGCMAGTLKKKRKLDLVSQKTEAGRVYRIAPEVEA